VIVAFLSSGVGTANEPAPTFSLIDEATPSVPAAAVLIDSHDIESWEDPSGVLSVHDIYSAPAGQVRLSEMPSRHVINWKRVQITNPGQETLDWALRILPPLFYKVDLFVLDADGTEYHRARYELGSEGTQGALDVPMPAFRIPFKPGRSTLVLRSQAMDIEQLTLFLDPIEKALHSVGRQHAFMGLYFGILGALAIYNILVWYVMRFSFIGYYLIFMFSWGLIAACIHGYIGYTFPAFSFLAKWIGPYTHAGIIAGTIFSQKFLKSSALAPRLDTWHKLAVITSIVFCLISFTPIDRYMSQWTSPGLEVFAAIQTLIVWITGFVVMARGFKPARFFVVGWSVSVAGIAVLLLHFRGFLPQNDFTRFSIQVSSAIEMILLALAVGERMRQLGREHLLVAHACGERDKLRSLVNFVVHDLASPLNAIQLQAEMGARGGPSDWGRVHDAVKQQKDILNFIREEGLNKTTPLASSLSPQDAPRLTNLDCLSTQLLGLLGERAATKKITLQLPNREDLSGVWVRTDEVILVHSMLGNLLENAIKFSPQGSKVTLRLKLEGPDWVRFEVEDQGIGIPQALISKIELGEAGAGISRAGTELESGSGNGLAIAKKFITHYHGTMLIKSRSSQDGHALPGTSIVVQLPRA
jgi:signal transduction histidine kinase